MKGFYKIANCRFSVEGAALASAVASLPGFHVFTDDEGEVLFRIVEASAYDAPEAGRKLFSLFHDGCMMEFASYDCGHLLVLRKEDEFLKLWRCSKGKVEIAGCFDPQMLRFAMWIGFGLETIGFRRVAMHCSCIVKDGAAYVFLGESGTGKSTHTRLWRENIPDAFLLNDDSPILSCEDGEVWVYGSPWSGKTPCYRNERYILGGCVRLSQAPFNEIVKLPVLKAFAALHPSCPPQFAPDDGLYDEISVTLDEVLMKASVWHLKCLPNAEAAHLSHDVLTKNQ